MVLQSKTAVSLKKGLFCRCFCFAWVIRLKLNVGFVCKSFQSVAYVSKTNSCILLPSVWTILFNQWCYLKLLRVSDVITLYNGLQ